MATPARAEQDARYLAMVGLGKPKAKRASRKKPEPEPSQGGGLGEEAKATATPKAKPRAKRASRKKPDPEPEREPIDITEPLGKVEAQLLFLDRVFTKDLGRPVPRWVPEPPPGLDPQELDGEPLQTEGPP